MTNKSFFLDHTQPAFIIAEVGNNHQGDVELAKKYIKVFAEHGASAVKFQTRDNKHLFSQEAYDRPYYSENSFAETYGEHREILELDPNCLYELKELTHSYGMKFISTPFDSPSLELLKDVGVDAIKIASFDCANIPFLSEISKVGLPVIMSTGGAKQEDIDASVEVLSGVDLALLHCVSEYPCPPEKLNLNQVKRIAEAYPHVIPGLSDHFNKDINGASYFYRRCSRSLRWVDGSFRIS